MVRLPHYRLIELLHESTGAFVYRGIRDEDGTPVTIKLPAGDPGPRAMQRLRDEYAILQSIDAPSVVRAIALEKHEGGLALVLEGFSGAPLNTLIASQALDLKAALEIAAGLARALCAVHRAGIIHCDVKPGNVIVHLATRTVKLIDFGIATRLEAESGEGAPAGELQGSLAYVSPEQTGRIDRRADTRSDLYSFGVTLYEVLTGRLPFQSSDPAELVHAHLARAPEPPSALWSRVPAVVSDLVMKLLEKAAEARYQRASGLLFDLERCLAELQSAGTIAPFPLGSRDARLHLAAPERLYGRDAERAALHEVIGRVAEGATELVFVEGPSGIGKSALVRELLPAIIARKGHFTAGKCDQKTRSAPYAPVAFALRELFRRIATEDNAARARLRDKLCAALGSAGQILIDLVPEAELVLGPQEAAPLLGPAEARNRLATVLGSAFRVLAGPEHPLVVFLDDLQWADPGTAWLLRVLFIGEAPRYLLILGALRDEALPADHPLPPVVAALRERGTAITTLRLGPLPAGDLRRFVADTLGVAEEQAALLSDLLFARTGGSPFFSYRLLRALHESGAIVERDDRGGLTVEKEQLDAAFHGGSVVELVLGELKKLPAETREVLVLAGAFGRPFDTETLALVSGRSHAEIDAALLPAIREGHIQPAGAGYRFAHDRLEQAALLLSDEAAKRTNAVQFGRLLLARAEESGRDEDLFDAADHLNEGAALLDSMDQRAALARTNLRAGRKARTKAAFEAAESYFTRGVSLLDEESFERDHELSFALHAALAECEASRGDEPASVARLERLDRHARAPLERVQAATIRVGLYVLVGKFAEAVRAGEVALRAFGIELPETDEARQAALEGVLARAAEDVASRPPASRLSAGDMVDAEALALERLLLALSVPAYFVAPALLGVVMMAWVDLVTARGHSDVSAMGYASYGFFLSFFPERQRDAYEIGKLALALNEKKQNRALLCKVMETFAGNIAFLHEPMRDVLARFPAALRAGLESGDFVHAAYICDHTVVMRLGIGDALEAIRKQADEFLPWIERNNDIFSATIMRIVQQVVANLTGTTKDSCSLGDEKVDEQEIALLVAGEGFSNLAAGYRTLRLMVLVVHGKWEEALAEAVAAEEKMAHAAGQFFLTDLTFFAALARIRAAGESPRGSPMLARHVESLNAWADLCPANYRHKELLVRAELARKDGDVLLAMQAYDDAIHAAREGEFVRDEALAGELSAEFYKELGRARISRAYATDACQGYLAWGATAKVQAMQHRETGALLRTSPAAGSWSLAPALASPITLTNTAGEGISALLDVSAVIRAAQAIASEILLPRVIEKLLRIVANSAGAERGHLVLERNGTWTLVARIGPEGIETGLDIPLDAASDVAASVVRQVAGTRDPVLLADAARDNQFALDPYIALHRTKSILCMEMTQKGGRAGIVYLENNALRGAFGKDRIEPLRILLSQAAIAIEIGRLYEEVDAAREQLRRANDGLRDEVARQTEQLRQELKVRTEAERERAVLSEEIIRVQEERILELEAPLLPITDEVVVMPLIGGVDAARAARVLETALGGAREWQAKVVIVDITGVKSAGAEVAAALIRTTRALRLLGAEVVITGVRAEVARALIGLGSDLGTVVTKSTLKAGIAHATRRRR